MVFVLFWLSQPVLAAKRRVRVRAVGLSYSSARISRSTHSLILTLSNLSKVAKVAYTLNYTANGIEQGVMGSLAPSGQTTDSRDLYFGTCSRGVCTPHYGLQNVTLLVSTTLTNGAVNVKRYRVKI